MNQALMPGRRNFVVASTAAALITAFRPLPARAAPVSIRYATGGGIGSSEIETVIFDQAMPRTALPHLDRDYTLQMTFTAGTPQAAALLAAGQADMATLSCSAFAAAILKDVFPSGVTIVSDNYQDGSPDHACNGFYVLEGSPIRGAEDLRGKTVAINAFGSAVDLILRVYLKRNGLDPKKDLQVVEIGLPNIGTALRQRRVDCGCLVLPFQAVEAKAGGLRALFSSADAIGPSSVVFNVVSNEFLKAHPDAVRAFLADYVGGLQWLMQPSNRSQAVAVMAGLTKLSADVLGSYVMTEKDYYRAPDGKVEAARIQKPIDALLELGLLPAPVSAAKYLDMSYLPA